MVKRLTQAEFDEVYGRGFSYHILQHTGDGISEVEKIMQFFEKVPLNLPSLHKTYLQTLTTYDDFILEHMENAMIKNIAKWLSVDAYPFVYEAMVTCNKQNNPEDGLTPVVELRVRPSMNIAVYTFKFWLGNRENTF